MTKFNTHQTRNLFLYLVQHDDLLHVVHVNTAKFFVNLENLLEVCFLQDHHRLKLADALCFWG
jgi:hypothetical protein